MGVSIEIFKVHTFFNMSTTPQAFFVYILLNGTLFYEEWYQFHFSTMICVGITTSVAFFLSTTVHNFYKSFYVVWFSSSWKYLESKKNWDTFLILKEILFTLSQVIMDSSWKFKSIIIYSFRLYLEVPLNWDILCIAWCLC